MAVCLHIVCVDRGVPEEELLYKRIDRRLLCSGEGAMAVFTERPATDALSDSQHAVHLVRQHIAAIRGLWTQPVNRIFDRQQPTRRHERLHSVVVVRKLRGVVVEIRQRCTEPNILASDLLQRLAGTVNGTIAVCGGSKTSRCSVPASIERVMSEEASERARRAREGETHVQSESLQLAAPPEPDSWTIVSAIRSSRAPTVRAPLPLREQPVTPRRFVSMMAAAAGVDWSWQKQRQSERES